MSYIRDLVVYGQISRKFQQDLKTEFQLKKRNIYLLWCKFCYIYFQRNKLIKTNQSALASNNVIHSAPPLRPMLLRNLPNFRPTGKKTKSESRSLQSSRDSDDVACLTKYRLKRKFWCVFSCDQAALRTLQSARLSVRPSVCHTLFTMFLSTFHHEIFSSDYQGQKWRPCERLRSEVKGQGHRGQTPI